MSSGSNGLRPRSHLVAGWTSGFSRGAIRPSVNAHPPSYPKFMTSSQNRGAPPTHLASVLLLPLLSHRLMALKRKDTRTCLLWMSLWPHISAHPQLSDGRRGRAIRPSCAEPHLHSLDAPTRLPVAQGLRRLSRQLSQRQPPLTPDLLRVGEIEGAHARHDATPSRSAKDPSPRLHWIRRLRSPHQPGRKRKGAEFSYHQTTAQAASNVPLTPPLNAGCRGKCVFGPPQAHFSAQVSDRCDSGQNKTHIF